MTVRSKSGTRFGSNPGPTSFLVVPPDKDDFDTSQIVSSSGWVRQVMALLDSMKSRDSSGIERSDLLVFVHGYNNLPPVVLQRQRQLQKDLADKDFKGVVVSFDWPSGDVALAYLSDRDHARRTAMALVKDCIELFVRTQIRTDCQVNVHVLAHSTGAYVVREAFDDSDDRAVTSSVNWMVSQMVFIGGDISASSLSQGNPETESIYRHCLRLTNYSNAFDEVLQLSNVKRAGLAPRVGRVGFPENAPPTAVDVECGEYYQRMITTRDPKTIIGSQSHSWHIGDPVWTEDLAQTLAGDLDRRAIHTREQLVSGHFKLVEPKRFVATARSTPVLVAPAAPNPT